MTDFQFDPGATNDPEENLHPYTMKPQTHGALDIHVLQISGQPMPAGAAMPVPKGPEPTKPTLHTGEPTQAIPSVGPNHDLAIYKTPEGGKVEYAYTKNGEPYEAYHVPLGGVTQYKTPDEINFPPHPFIASKPVLHVEEPQSDPTMPLSMKAKTPNGSTVFYDYTSKKQPLSATVYDETGAFESYHKPSEIAFPALKTPVKSPSDQLETEITKLLGPEKPTLHVGELKAHGEGAVSAVSSEGWQVWYGYANHKPEVAVVYDKNGLLQKEYKPHEINFPVHPDLEPNPLYNQKSWEPDEASKPTLHTGPLISDLGQTLHASAPNGEHVYYDYDSGGKSLKAEVFGSDGTIKKTYQPDEINFPVFPGSKPSLAKVNLPENYPKEEQIDELYNKPQESVTAYPKFSPKEPLTESEQNLISDYTGSFYHEIANHIYGHSPNPKLEPKIEAINKAIAKHPLAESVTLYRGLSYDNFQKFANLKPGQTATYDGFMSTSSNKHVGSKWKEGYHFVIETPVGTPALPVKHMSQHSGENEVLLSTKTKLKFIRREGNALHFEVVPRTE